MNVSIEAPKRTYATTAGGCFESVSEGSGTSRLWSRIEEDSSESSKPKRKWDWRFLSSIQKSLAWLPILLVCPGPWW